MTWFLPEAQAASPPDRPILSAQIPDWWGAFGATFQAQRLPSRASGLAWGQGVSADLVDELEAQAGITGGIPQNLRMNPRQAIDVEGWRKARLFYAVTEARKADPRAMPGLPANEDEFAAELGRRVKSTQDELRATLANDPNFGAQLAGGLAEFATRPSSVLALPLTAMAGPEIGVGRMIAGQALIGAAQGGIDVMDQTGTAQVTGEAPPSFGEAVATITESALMNAGLTVAGHYLGQALKSGYKGAAARYQAWKTAAADQAGKQIPPGIGGVAAQKAVARAETALTDPDVKPPPGGGTDAGQAFDLAPFAVDGATRPDALSGLQPDFRAKLGALFEGAPEDIRAQLRVMSAFRSPEVQAQLWADALKKYGSAAEARKWVAPPGHSQHGAGYAADLRFLSPEAQAWVHAHADEFGLTFPLPNEPWHVELQGARGRNVASAKFADNGAPPAQAPEAAAPSTYTTSRGYTGTGQIAAAGQTPAIQVRYEVVDASSLQRATGELQPRDRSRTTSDAQVASIAAGLDPAQLMPGPLAQHGPPIVGPDNVIESGNGRVMAIARAAELHPDRAAAYRAQIEAAGYTIPEGVQTPVLIARRETAFTPAERARAVQDWNASTTAQMTPSEVARVSASRMTPDTLATLDPTRPLSDAANSDFLRRSLDQVPESARNAMFEPSGGLNQLGQLQMRAALFARAWPDADILARYAETDAGELRSLLDALEMAAPQEAALKGAIEAGQVAPQMDIGDHVLEAMRTIAQAREIAAQDGITVQAALGVLLDTPDLLEGPVSPLTTALIRKFWKDGRAAPAKDIGSFLSRYAEEARKAGGVGDMFAASPRDILKRLDPEGFGDLPQDLGHARTVATGPADAAIRTSYPDQGYAKGAMSPEAQSGDEAIRAAAEAELAPAVEPARPPGTHSLEAMVQAATDRILAEHAPKRAAFDAVAARLPAEKAAILDQVRVKVADLPDQWGVLRGALAYLSGERDGILAASSKLDAKSMKAGEKLARDLEKAPAPAAADASPVSPTDATRAALASVQAEARTLPGWADLVIRVDDQDPGVRMADLLADIEDDLNTADVILACNPKGGPA